MGSLFDDCDEFPNYEPMPRFRATIDGVVVPLAIAATLYGICPVVLEDHHHPPHHDHGPDGDIAMRLFAPSSSTSSGGNITVAIPSGVLAISDTGPIAALVEQGS